MRTKERIKAFSELGEIIRNSLNGDNADYSEQLNNLMLNQERSNAWFTPENVRMAIEAIGNNLTPDKLKAWVNKYPSLSDENTPFTAAVVMAGNIPLVGFHDFLSVLITGNRILAKTSSRDSELIVFIGSILCSLNPEFVEYIEFTEGRLSGFDAVIATGSNNSSRYFEYYFGKYPNIIRKNRNSIAIIDGNETSQELENLGTDIFSYFGLGCRNVSKIFIPEGFDPRSIIKHLDRFSAIIDHNKYANNYDFSKAVWMINKEKFFDTGYMLLKESKELASPVAVLYYEFYNSEKNLKSRIDEIKNNIQCISGREYIPFGRSQFPELWDYADNIDTIDFLLKKNQAGIL